MAIIKSVENGVQAKSVIESFITEGYERDHIHIFANSNKRAEDIADFFDVDASKTPGTTENDKGFLASIKNFFQSTPEDLHHQLADIGVGENEHATAKNDLDAGKILIVAHHPGK
ncbi:general stress protein [Solibacillus sp. NPDC093137]|uniref:general stress protein n=1 Tax=Solibacillus sp. NPDC093137 TaxID=3390678 RepID=UPI003D033AF7